MRILLVTNLSNHHKFWAYEMFSKFNVVGIMHPNAKPNRKKLFKELKNNGFVFTILKVLSFFYHKYSKHSFSKKLEVGQNYFFSESIKNYNKIPKKIIINVGSVNDSKSIEIAKELQPDIICFLGGDIAKNKFLSVAKLATLNYHSGLSPFHNGSGTTFTAVSEGRPNFCGGTLMLMNERIDGGKILAHYLTPIQIDDTASSLFFKGIKGAAELYYETINFIIKTNKIPKGIKQERSVRYCKTSDWTIYQDIKLMRNETKSLMKKYIREKEALYFYDDTYSYPPYLLTLSKILKKNVK